ncbi:MAG: acetyltransferase, partial [Methylovulum miyakonense]|uniref:acetyltransferase n=1 Tax=Methylovulum miyakonense TaxID=645578 RepID=UPI003BB4F447
EILGTDQEAEVLCKKLDVKNVVVTLDSPKIKEQLWLFYQKFHVKFPSIISRKAEISKHAIINSGVIIQNGVNISANCRLGKLTKINVNANLMHDVQVGDFTTIAPNAVFLGYVHISSSVFVGANATILPHRVIGKNAIVGAGAVVTKPVDADVTVVGNPANPIKYSHAKG